MVQGATEFASKPYEQYGGMEVAPENGWQTGARNLLEDRIMGGAPDMQAARGAAYNAAAGNYANPWASNVSGIAQGQAYNPAMAGASELAAGTSNPFGSDEYTQQILKQNTDNMTSAWQTGGAAQNDAMANQAGGWGGGGWRAMQESGNAALNKQIGQMGSQLLQDQQRYKGGLFDQDRSARERGLQMQGGMYNSDVQNQLNANQQGAGIYQQDIGNILQGAQLGGNLSQEDWLAFDKMQGIGNQQQQYMQKLLDAQKGQYTAAQNYPAQMLDILSTALGKASGVGGQSFSQTTQPGLSPATIAAGLGSAAYGLWG
jgi:hypothetical protein